MFGVDLDKIISKKINDSIDKSLWDSFSTGAGTFAAPVNMSIATTTATSPTVPKLTLDSLIETNRKLEEDVFCIKAGIKIIPLRLLHKVTFTEGMLLEVIVNLDEKEKFDLSTQGIYTNNISNISFGPWRLGSKPTFDIHLITFVELNHTYLSAHRKVTYTQTTSSNVPVTYRMVEYGRSWGIRLFLT
jgi:hypothetical protein